VAVFILRRYQEIVVTAENLRDDSSGNQGRDLIAAFQYTKGAYKMGTNFSARPVAIGKRQ